MSLSFRCFLACVVALGVATAPVQAQVKGRYIRVEAPVSLRMGIHEIELFQGDKNIALKNPKITFSGLGYKGAELDARKDGRRLVDGVKNLDDRSVSIGLKEGVNAWVELDLGSTMPLDRLTLVQSPGPQFLDLFQRLVTVLDEKRQVVFSASFDIREKAYAGGVATFDLKPGGQFVGTTVPSASMGWVPLGKFLPLQKPALPPDAPSRRALFANRNQPVEIEKLAKTFFRLLDEKALGLDTAFASFRAGRYQHALDEYRAHFFRKIRGLENSWGHTLPAHVYAKQADDLSSGVTVQLSPKTVRALAFEPGLMPWSYLPDAKNPKEQDLELVRANALVNDWGRSLLHTFAETGDLKYLHAWSQIADDWAMFFFPEIERSPHNLRGYFAKDPLQWFNYFCYELDQINQKRPQLATSIPSATLARLLLPVLEEYPAQYYRTCRRLVYNHTFNALQAAYTTAKLLGDFHAGQRMMVEFRQHFERSFVFAITRDGQMIEVGDEGHMAMPLETGRLFLEMQKDQPAWFTPGFQEMFKDHYRNMSVRLLRNLTPGGYDHRMNTGDAFARTFTLTKKIRSFKGGFEVPSYSAHEIFDDPEVRAILDTVWGRGQDLKTLGPVRAKNYSALVDFLGGQYQGPPKTVSDWMPYAGLHYLRGGWRPDDSFVHFICQNDGGGAHALDWDTEFRYHDFGYPLVRVEPIAIDRLRYDPQFGRLGAFPGNRTDRIVNAPEKPANNRWLSTDRFDFAETLVQGGYQNNQFARTPASLIRSGGVAGVTTTRQLIQVKGHRLFIAVDRVHHDKAPGKHSYALNYDLTATTNKGQTIAGKQLQFDPKSATLRLDNPNSPGLDIHHFAEGPVNYRLDARSVKEPAVKKGEEFPADLGFASRVVELSWQATGDTALVSLLVPRQPGKGDRVRQIEGKGLGFIATLDDGTVIRFQAAPKGTADLPGPVKDVQAEMTLQVRSKAGEDWLVLGAMTDDPAAPGDYQASLPANQIVPIQRPIDPVTISPGANVFADAVDVTLSSQTPGIEIYYTINGGPEARYLKPVRIEADAFIKADAKRPGLKDRPFDASGVQVTAPSYAQFTKKALLPARKTDALVQGLEWEMIEGTWLRLFSHADIDNAKERGTTGRLFDVSPRKTDGPFAMRYSGYIDVPRDGVYTFHAPKEAVLHTCEPGYDLRVFVDGQEWDLSQQWHGLGTWSIPLAKGPHVIRVVFADARAKDVDKQRSDLHRAFPTPWTVQREPVPTLSLSGPGLPMTPLPNAWLHRAK